jgi:carboxypeptidase C (cathepsin A)
MSSILRINSTPPCALAGAWNRRSALLFVDQPIGAGFSVPGAFSRCGPSSATLDCLPLTRCCQNQQRCRIGTFAMHCFAHERHVRCVWSLLVGAGRDIPRDELTLAADLYAALQAFFLARPCLQQRPLVIAGESYAGKYVPSIGHFILQQAARHNASLSLGAPRAIPSPAKTRKLPPALAAARPLLSRPPLFDLRALAIGNGLTDPAVQVGCDVEL